MTLLRQQRGDESCALAYFDHRLHRIVVRAAHSAGAQEFETVASNGKAAARLQRHVLLDLVALYTACADGEYADAKMRKRHAEQCRAECLFATQAAQGFQQR